MQHPLNQKIDIWKEQLEDAGIFTEAQMLELEDHLHQKIDDLLASGAEEDRAFSEASLSLGHPIALGQAYSISNRKLLLKQIGLYFLLGFPIISFLLEFPQIIYNISNIFLIEYGYRSVSLGMLSTLILLPIVGLYLWYFIRHPYGLIELPKKIARLGWKAILFLFFLISSFLFVSHFEYYGWINAHNGLSPSDYIHYSFTRLYLPFWHIAQWGLFGITLLLLISINLEALVKTGTPRKTWNKVALLSLILGFFTFKFIGSYLLFQFFANQPGGITYEHTLHLKEWTEYVLIVSSFVPALLWGGYFYFKQKYFIAHG